MEFYIEILIIGKQSVADNVEKLYNCEISEYYVMDSYIKIYKFKTNKHKLFVICNDRFEFVDKNIFPMIASDDPHNHHNLKIIVLLGVNYEFSIHYKFDDIHTMEPNKMFIINYDEQKNKEMIYNDIGIMSNDQFLILNKNLPVHRRITRLILNSRILNGYTNQITDQFNTDNHKKILDQIKINSYMPDHLNIKSCNCANFNHVNYKYNPNHPCIYQFFSIWINLQRLAKNEYHVNNLVSKIIYYGNATVNINKFYYLENLYSDYKCQQIYIDSDSPHMLLNDLVLPIIDPISPQYKETETKGKIKIIKLSTETKKEEIQIVKQKLSMETKRAENYKNSYLEIIELFNSISRKKIEPDEF
jgi:hypothetical protein